MLKVISPQSNPRVAVIWIDWYAYHVARFRGLVSEMGLAGSVQGIELVGGMGVHAGLKFREELPTDLPVKTLMPDASWCEASQWHLAAKLWRYLSELSPEVVLIPGYYTVPALAAAFWARLHGRTGVLMTESTAYDHHRVWWKERIKTFGLRLFEWAVTGGSAHVAYLQQLGFRTDRITGSYDVVDNELFRAGVKQLRKEGLRGFDLPDKYFLYVGRLAKEKNVLGLLQSWLSYRARGGSWSLVLVGDGSEADILRVTAGMSAYKNNVHFAGLKASRELLPFYAFASTFVLPSVREPWGLVVNEAMAAELPVLVSSRSGCAADLVRPGINGFHFDPYDLDALTNLLEHMEQLPAHDLHRMAASSADIICDFSPQHFGRSIASIANHAMTYTGLKALPEGTP